MIKLLEKYGLWLGAGVVLVFIIVAILLSNMLHAAELEEDPCPIDGFTAIPEFRFDYDMLDVDPDGFVLWIQGYDVPSGNYLNSAVIGQLLVDRTITYEEPNTTLQLVFHPDKHHDFATGECWTINGGMRL